MYRVSLRRGLFAKTLFVEEGISRAHCAELMRDMRKISEFLKHDYFVIVTHTSETGICTIVSYTLKKGKRRILVPSRTYKKEG